MKSTTRRAAHCVLEVRGGVRREFELCGGVIVERSDTGRGMIAECLRSELRSSCPLTFLDFFPPAFLGAFADFLLGVFAILIYACLRTERRIAKRGSRGGVRGEEGG